MSYQEDFIGKIAPVVQKMTVRYGYGVNSAIIAQACLESAYGTSTKAKHHNYFGLKYRPNRVSCSSGMFKDGSREQLQGGKYIKIVDNWYGFATMEDGVEGYLQFISIPNYDRARAVTDPEEYLQALKDAGYATSAAYVSNNMSVIKKWDLTKYDTKKVDVSKGSVKVIEKPKITKMISKYNFESRSGNAIKYIVLHYTGNQTDTAKNNANYFATGNRGASAHYFVDETSIYQSVEDSAAAWHVGKNYGSGNLFGKCTNKNSIGIEMCSKNGTITSKTITRAVELTRYLMALYGVPASNVVRHWDICSKECPGWYGWNPKSGSEATWEDFKERIQSGESQKAAATSAKKKTKVPFIVKVTIPDLNIRKGPGVKYGKTGKYTGIGKFTIIETDEKEEWGRLKSGAGWIYIADRAWTKWPV